MSVVALYSLFPLFNGIQEKYTKILILVSYMYGAYEMLSRYYNNSTTTTVTTYGNTIVTIVIGTSIIITEFLSFIYIKRYPFLSLLLTSIVCAMILLKLWVQYLMIILKDFFNNKTKTH